MLIGFVFNIVSLLGLIFFMDESPLWLYAQRNTKQGNKVVKRIMRINGFISKVKPASYKPQNYEVNDNEEDEFYVDRDLLVRESIIPSKDDEMNYTTFEYLRFTDIRRNIILMIVTWVVFTLGYYILSF